MNNIIPNITQIPTKRPFLRRKKTCPFSGDKSPKIDYKDTKLLYTTTIDHIYNEIIPISKYMRIHQWINNDSKDEKKFGCVCENYF